MFRNWLKRIAGEGAATDAADRLIAEGRKLEDAGSLQQALAHYREAATVAPRHPGAHLNLGVALEASGDAEDALRSYQQVLEIEPANAYAQYNLGKLHFQRRAFPQAEAYLRAAIRAKQEFPEAHVVLANLRDAQGEYQDCAALLEVALRQRPGYAGAWFNYATTLVKLDRYGEAEAAARKAIEHDPKFFPAHVFLGDLLRTDGRLEEAVETFRRARPLSDQGLECEQAELHALNYFDGVTDEALFERHREVGARIEAAWPARFPTFAGARDPDRRLRVGYVSRDFFRHPVSWFLQPVLERHDRSQVEVYCYATTSRSDDVTAHLRAAADRWVDAARMTHADVAETIHRDRVDILVDLLGHAGSSDLAVFAQQPAPVQVTWLGYLNTTGLTRMHYRLCDAVTDPPGVAERMHTETLVRLPSSQWCYRPYKEMELSRAHALEPPCTRNGFVTFGSFNHRLKLSTGVLALWARILRALPDARLIVMGVPLGPAQDRLREQFTRAGVEAARLTIVAPVSMNDYFLWFDEVDLALDSTPYSGGTTTCDTLWMGVPVVTATGTRSVSRSAASILATVGLADWVGTTHDEYVDLALKFARDPALLASLRSTLRQRMRASPLMDEPRFTRDLESAYRSMWRAWCAKGSSERVS